MGLTHNSGGGRSTGRGATPDVQLADLPLKLFCPPDVSDSQQGSHERVESGSLSVAGLYAGAEDLDGSRDGVYS